jgi:hypothetical protein
MRGWDLVFGGMGRRNDYEEWMGEERKDGLFALGRV